MRNRHLVIVIIAFLLNSCIKHNLSSGEVDDVYFTKKDIIPIEEVEEIVEETEVEEVK